MCFLKNVDVLRDALHLRIIRHHLGGEIDKFTRVEAAAVDIEVIDELFGGNSNVKRAREPKIAVPELVDGVSINLAVARSAAL